MADEAKKARHTPRHDSAIRDLAIRIEAALASLGVHDPHVFRDEGLLQVRGSVRTQQQMEHVRAVLRQVEGAEGVANNVEVVPLDDETSFPELNLPGGASNFTTLDQGYEEGVEPDPTPDDVGAEDMMEAISEAEPYFPPTDIVERPLEDSQQGVEILGGFSSTSMEEPTEVEDHPLNVQRGDDEIAQDVHRALLLDSGTTDLEIAVFVRRGIVHLRGRVNSLEDADQAEEVASRVPGVVEIREELDVQGLS